MKFSGGMDFSLLRCHTPEKSGLEIVAPCTNFRQAAGCTISLARLQTIFQYCGTLELSSEFQVKPRCADQAVIFNFENSLAAVNHSYIHTKATVTNSVSRSSRNGVSSLSVSGKAVYSISIAPVSPTLAPTPRLNATP